MTGAPAAMPADVCELLDGAHLREKASTTILLATADQEGWPNLSMLSPGEVLGVDPYSLRLAVHPRSRTCEALRTTGRALLSVVVGGAAYRIRLRVRHISDPPIAGSDQLFEARVEQVTEDRVGYAKVTHGIGYELEDIEGTLQRWEAKLGRLRQVP